MTEEEHMLMQESDRAQMYADTDWPYVEDLHFHADGDGTYTVVESESNVKESTLSDNDGGWSVISRWLW